MEEDIFIVESFLKNKKMLSKHPVWVSEKTLQAIENLINKNKELTNHLDMAVNEIDGLRKENKELEKMVELMAKYIQALISKYEDDTYTYTSIIDYFKKKASDNNE